MRYLALNLALHFMGTLIRCLVLFAPAVNLKFELLCWIRTTIAAAAATTTASPGKPIVTVTFESVSFTDALPRCRPTAAVYCEPSPAAETLYTKCPRRVSSLETWSS